MQGFTIRFVGWFHIGKEYRSKVFAQEIRHKWDTLKGKRRYGKISKGEPGQLAPRAFQKIVAPSNRNG